MVDNRLSILKQCKIFCDLSEEVLRQTVLPLGTSHVYGKNSTVITFQDVVTHFGVIVQGRVHIVQIFPDGAGSLMQRLLPSYLLGADLVCTESQQSPYFAITAAETTILFFPAELLFAPGILSEPDWKCVSKRLLNLIANENMRKYYRLAILSHRGLRERILTYLTMQAAKRNSNSFRIPFSREELASFLCVNRSALSHELGLMAKEGLIQFRKNQFTLLTEKLPKSWQDNIPTGNITL